MNVSAEARFLRLPAVLARVGVTTSTIYRWIDDKRFPGPVRIGPHTSAWLASDVDRWINQRVRESKGVAA